MQALETRASDLERDSVVKDARAKSMQEVLHLQETKVLNLQQTLAEAGKEAAASRQRANAAEERAVAAEQVGVERAREAAARLQLENRELSHRLEEANASRIVRSGPLCIHDRDNSPLWAGHINRTQRMFFLLSVPRICHL